MLPAGPDPFSQFVKPRTIPVRPAREAVAQPEVTIVLPAPRRAVPRRAPATSVEADDATIILPLGNLPWAGRQTRSDDPPSA